MRLPSEEEVDEAEAVVAETSSGREAEDLNNLAPHTQSEQGPSHHSPHLKICKQDCDNSGEFDRLQGGVKAINIFKLSMPNKRAIIPI